MACPAVSPTAHGENAVKGLSIRRNKRILHDFQEVDGRIAGSGPGAADRLPASARYPALAAEGAPRLLDVAVRRREARKGFFTVGVRSHGSASALLRRMPPVQTGVGNGRTVVLCCRKLFPVRERPYDSVPFWCSRSALARQRPSLTGNARLHKIISIFVLPLPGFCKLHLRRRVARPRLEAVLLSLILAMLS